MLVTFLNILLYVLKFAEVLAVTLILVIGIDLAIYLYNESHPTPRVKKRRLFTAFIYVVAGTMHVATEIKLAMETRKKRRILAKKEATARESFFEEPYECGFDSHGTMLYRGCQVVTEKNRTINQVMDDIDDLMDAEIFNNTKDL